MKRKLPNKFCFHCIIQVDVLCERRDEIDNRLGIRIVRLEDHLHRSAEDNPEKVLQFAGIDALHRQMEEVVITKQAEHFTRHRNTPMSGQQDGQRFQSIFVSILLHSFTNGNSEILDKTDNTEQSQIC